MDHQEHPTTELLPHSPIALRQNLRTQCIFCEPALHGQESQVLLRSDHFYLFAGLGPIVEGYIIIAPYRCDDPKLPLRSLSDVPPILVDELLFLRGLVAHFYREVYGHPGMHFEHGRAGGCFLELDDTKHCYHAHLCCYPAYYPLWDDLKEFHCEEIEDLHKLGDKVGDSPYLFVQGCEVDANLVADMAEREKWQSWIVLLKKETKLPSQYLRKLLAMRACAEEEFRWDWLGVPELPRVQKLIQVFQNWLPKQNRYVVTVNGNQSPTLNFGASINCSNAVGNNYVARKFFDKWSGLEQYGTVGRFLRYLPDRRGKHPDGTPNRPRVLDAGCGPGTYLNVFYHLGIECVGIDLSDKMLEIARNLSTAAQRMYGNQRPVSPPRLFKMDAFAPTFGEQSFDGIWYSAVFVHLPRGQAPHTLARLYNILKDDGILYLSAQMGNTDAAMRYEGRVFFYYTVEELQTLFRQSHFEVIEAWGDRTDFGTCGDTREKRWNHYLLKKMPLIGTGS